VDGCPARHDTWACQRVYAEAYCGRDVKSDHVGKDLPGAGHSSTLQETLRTEPFLDASDPYVSTELEDVPEDEGAETGDEEPSLGSHDRNIDQTGWGYGATDEAWIDCELEEGDNEPSLGWAPDEPAHGRWRDAAHSGYRGAVRGRGDHCMSNDVEELANEIVAFANLLGTLFAGRDADTAIEGARLIALEIGARAHRIKQVAKA